MRNTIQISPRDKIAYRFYDHVLGLSFSLIGFSDGLTTSLMELFPDTWLDHKRSQNVEHSWSRIDLSFSSTAWLLSRRRVSLNAQPESKGYITWICRLPKPIVESTYEGALMIRNWTFVT